MREGNRSRGVGLVEFETRESLVEALKRTDKEVYGRKIRINISDKTDLHQTDGNRGNFNYRSNRTGEERPEMADRWKRIERKSDELSDDRPRNDFNRDRPNRSDHGRCKAFFILSSNNNKISFFLQQISPVILAIINVGVIMDLAIHVPERIDKDHVSVIITMMIIDRTVVWIDRDILLDPVILTMEIIHLMVLIILSFLY
jgi:hypothetical protein